MHQLIAEPNGGHSGSANSHDATSHDHTRARNSRSLIGAANSATSFEDALRELDQNDGDLESAAVRPADLRVADGRLIDKDREYRIAPEGFARLCRRLRAPAEYVRQLGPKMRARLLGYHLRRGEFSGGLTNGNARIVARKGMFLDLCRGDLQTLGGADVLRAARDGAGGDGSTLEVRSLRVEDASFRIDIVSPGISAAVRPDDIIQGGVRIEHSLLGEAATSIEAYVVRLLCSNGAVRRECLGRANAPRSTPRTRRLPSDHQGAADQQREQVRRLVEGTWLKLQEKLGAITHLRDEPFDIARMEHFLRQGRLYSTRLMRLLQLAWEQDMGGNRETTAFGVLNALTWLATYPDAFADPADHLSPRQARAMERLAGLFATRHKHLCPRCFRML